MEDKIKYTVYASMVLSIVAFILSLIAVSRTLHTYLRIDSLGLLVGILALLVTTLIGWQIFVLIDLKNYDSKFRNLSDEVTRNDLATRGYASLGYARTNIAWLTEAKKEEWLIEYIRHSLLALSFFSMLDDYKRCWAITGELIDTIELNIKDKNSNFYVALTKNKQEFLRALGEVEDVVHIDNFKDLLKIISSL